MCTRRNKTHYELIAKYLMWCWCVNSAANNTQPSLQQLQGNSILKTHSSGEGITLEYSRYTVSVSITIYGSQENSFQNNYLYPSEGFVFKTKGMSGVPTDLTSAPLHMPPPSFFLLFCFCSGIYSQSLQQFTTPLMTLCFYTDTIDDWKMLSLNR